MAVGNVHVLPYEVLYVLLLTCLLPGSRALTVKKSPDLCMVHLFQRDGNSVGDGQ